MIAFEQAIKGGKPPYQAELNEAIGDIETNIIKYNRGLSWLFSFLTALTLIIFFLDFFEVSGFVTIPLLFLSLVVAVIKGVLTINYMEDKAGEKNYLKPCLKYEPLNNLNHLEKLSDNFDSYFKKLGVMGREVVLGEVLAMDKILHQQGRAVAATKEAEARARMYGCSI